MIRVGVEQSTDDNEKLHISIAITDFEDNTISREYDVKFEEDESKESKNI